MSTLADFARVSVEYRAGDPVRVEFDDTGYCRAEVVSVTYKAGPYDPALGIPDVATVRVDHDGTVRTVDVRTECFEPWHDEIVPVEVGKVRTRTVRRWDSYAKAETVETVRYRSVVLSGSSGRTWTTETSADDKDGSQAVERAHRAQRGGY